MISNSARWSHAHGKQVVPSPWQATNGLTDTLRASMQFLPGHSRLTT